MDNQIKKPYWKLIVAALFIIVGFLFFVWISSPQMDFSKIAANEITETQDAAVSDFYLLGKMGTKDVGGKEYSYYIILAQDKSGTRFTLGMRVDAETSAEFENIAGSYETAQTIPDKFYGSIEAMDETTAQTYDSLLEEYGYASTYPNLYLVFSDSQNTSGTSGGLGLIFLIPFIGFGAFFVISFIKSTASKDKNSY